MSLPVPPIKVSAPPPPTNRSFPPRAIQYVDASVSNDRIVRTVAGAVDCATRGLQHQGFDIRWRSVGDRRPNRVGTFAGILRDHVASIVDDKLIVTGAADHGIGTGTTEYDVITSHTVENVVAHIADQHIVQAIAGAVNRPSAVVHTQVFYICTERVTDRGPNDVGSLSGILGDHIANIVDYELIVSDSAEHGIGTGAPHEEVIASHTVENVAARIANDDIVETVARAVDRTSDVIEGEVLDICRECVVYRRPDKVGTFAGILADRIADIVDDECIVAEPADHCVGTSTSVDDVIAGPTVKHVNAGVAEDHVVQAIAGTVDRTARVEQRQILDVARQRVSY